MGLIGSDPPVLKAFGQTVAMPAPTKEDTGSPYKDVSNWYQNIDGDNIPGERKWRFDKTYKWSALDSSIYDVLVSAYNKGEPVVWTPHSDTPFISYRCFIMDLKSQTFDGYEGVNSVEMRVESISLVRKIPSIDNMFRAFSFRRIGVFNG